MHASRLLKSLVELQRPEWKFSVGRTLGRVVLVLPLTAILLAGTPVHATVIDKPDVVIGANSYRAFQDTTTGNVWLDLDNFFSKGYTYNGIVALLSGSDFHLATLPEMAALQASIPAVPGNFAAEVLIVGGNYPGSLYADGARSLMFGAYDDGDSAMVSTFWRYDITAGPWSHTTDSISSDLPLSNLSADFGAWVIGPTQAIPEPETYALLLTGLGLLGFVARPRKNQKVASAA